ncbi:WD repeat-containing protein 41 [Holothuria leucospilota]|uniref:WD repeat-containing protein 41 n=1 Tax=Holothuria leucospilota TaxID=206669 RepID=A0A9Q1H0N7_HOLLE|nr:WD repeat-containing protein 41 [Holothuria leucospilota]
MSGAAELAMAAILRKKGRRNNKPSSGVTQEVEVERVPENQPQNPFTEIHILASHSDVIRTIIPLDGHRFLSVSDDHTAIVWSTNSSSPLCVLTGHTGPVICSATMMSVQHDEDRAYPLKEQVLLTGSLDKTIRVWSLDTGECMRVLKDHFTYVKVLCDSCVENLFCAGGTDLHLWNLEGDLLHTVILNGEDISHVLAIPHGRIVVAAANTLEVFKVPTSPEILQELEKIKKLAPNHREMILSLETLSGSHFVSSSLDGTIIIWNSTNLTMLIQLNHQKDYLVNHTYPYCVHHTLSIDQKFLFAAVGRGLALYTLNGDCIWRRENAHHSKILYLCLVYNGMFLASCSEDGSIRLWGAVGSMEQPTEGSMLLHKEISDSSLERLLGKSVNSKEKKRLLRKEDKYKIPSPVLLGECMSHSGAVQKVLAFDDNTMVSCGSDGVIILWKDGAQESELRNEQIRKILHFNSVKDEMPQESQS